MAETKDEIAAEREKLRADNQRLREQLNAAGHPGAPAAQHRFLLSEGERQELEIYGVVAKDGVVLTREEVLDRLGDDQAGIEIGEPTAGNDKRAAVLAQRRQGGNVRGVDFVYPSVTRGGIDPAVAGTPGINGPAADQLSDVDALADVDDDDENN